MRRLSILWVAYAVLSSGAAHGNSFLDGMVGGWSNTYSVSATLKGKVILKETYRGTARVIKRKTGTYYAAGFNEKGIKDEETWFYKNGRFSSIYYTDKGAYYGEGRGTWRIRNGRLVMDETAENLKFERIRVNYSMRRINRNKYVVASTGAANATLPATAKNTLRLRGASTLVRLP